MKTIHLGTLGLIVLLLLVVWNVGQAQDSLGMHHVTTLDYWQYANDIEMVGDLAYVVSGTSGLHIVDLTDPTDPQEIGRGTWYDWEDATGGIYITNNRAYVANDCGCSAFDISDPTNPIQLARWWEDRIQYDIFVHDTIAIIQGEDMQVIVDISDLENVQQIGDFGYRMMWPLGMADEYLCMASSEGGLLMFDISDPSQPVEVAQVDTTMTGGMGTIVGNYAFWGTFNDGVRIIDVSDPLQPIEAASCDSGWCCNLTVTNSYLAISKGLTLNIWNVADPAHPYLECIFPAPPGITIVSGSENLICAGSCSDSISAIVVDISNPATPVQVSSFGPVGFLGRIEIDSTTGYLSGASFPGSGGRGLCITDLANPVNPEFLGIIHNAGVIALRGNYLYSVGNRYHGMVVYDVSNPAEPESLHFTPGFNLREIEIEGNYAYVIKTSQGWPAYLHTFSLVNPVAPMLVDSLSIPYFTTGIAFAGRTGYLYLGADGYSCGYLLIYSLVNPEEPLLVGTGTWSEGYLCGPTDLVLTNHYACVSDYAGGLVTLDITQPENPVVVGQMLADTITHVAAIGSTVVTDGNCRINVWDMSDPSDPRTVGYYPTLEIIRDIRILGSYAVTISSSEFRVYQCDALSVMPSPPEVVPDEFNLYPCYPNPFNSTLTIPFTLPIQSDATITIHNILGQCVTTFDIPEISPGTHRISWNAGSCASGIYIVKLSAAGEVHLRKVLLLK